MPSANKTERLGLNLWQGSDRPQRNDFNSDNFIVEEVVGDHIENTEIHLSEAEKTRVRMPMVTVSFVGNGEARRTVALPSVVTTVIVFCDSMPCAVYDSTTLCTRNYAGFSMYGAGFSAGINFNSMSVTVSQDEEPENGFMNCLNESGKTYRVIGFR
ncbi:MAG: hypothetical protein IJD93_06265 [Ruminococcus sp.]|nr:hypothetical protein [Ruminococcus sp.]